MRVWWSAALFWLGCGAPSLDDAPLCPPGAPRQDGLCAAAGGAGGQAGSGQGVGGAPGASGAPGQAGGAGRIKPLPVSCDQGSCPHGVCEVGDALPGCSACSAKVCESNPSCCEVNWGASCVRDALDLCECECPGGRLCEVAEVNHDPASCLAGQYLPCDPFSGQFCGKFADYLVAPGYLPPRFACDPFSSVGCNVAAGERCETAIERGPGGDELRVSCSAVEGAGALCEACEPGGCGAGLVCLAGRCQRLCCHDDDCGQGGLCYRPAARGALKEAVGACVRGRGGDPEPEFPVTKASCSTTKPPEVHHPLVVGAPLAGEQGCSARVCGRDPFCCNVAWDERCVGEAGVACSCSKPPSLEGKCGKGPLQLDETSGDEGCSPCRDDVVEAASALPGFFCSFSWGFECVELALQRCDAPVDQLAERLDPSGRPGFIAADSAKKSACLWGSCPHPVTRVGAALSPGCSACAAQVCEQDPACCEIAWDAACAARARQSCECVAGCAGKCAHSPFEAGGALAQGCSPCASQLLDYEECDGSGGWSEFCVYMAEEICACKP